MDADKQFTIAFSRMAHGFAVIDSLRKVTDAGMKSAARVVAEEDTYLVDYLISSGKLSRFIIGIKDQDDLQKTGAWLRGKLTEQKIKNAAYSIDAASLVFAHTVLDDALSSFLAITAQVAPEFWQKRMEKKQVEISALRDRTFEEILNSVIAKEVAVVRRSASLIEKCDLLNAICKPDTGTQAATDYKFDRDILRSIDLLRQGVIHGDRLGSEIPETQKHIEYLRETWNFFFIAMHKSFGLRIDPSALSTPQAS